MGREELLRWLEEKTAQLRNELELYERLREFIARTTQAEPTQPSEQGLDSLI